MICHDPASFPLRHKPLMDVRYRSGCLIARDKQRRCGRATPGTALDVLRSGTAHDVRSVPTQTPLALTIHPSVVISHAAVTSLREVCYLRTGQGALCTRSADRSMAYTGQQPAEPSRLNANGSHPATSDKSRSQTQSWCQFVTPHITSG